MNGSHIPTKTDLTAFQRGVLLGYHLAQGEGMTTGDVAEMAGVQTRRAQQMVQDAAAVIPLQRTSGVWEVAFMGEGEV